MDSLLEGAGFELPVPRAMQARLQAKIAGIGCIPPSIICGCRRWPSAQAQSEISEPNPYRARKRKFESISLQRSASDEPRPSRVERSPRHGGLPWRKWQRTTSAPTSLAFTAPMSRKTCGYARRSRPSPPEERYARPALDRLADGPGLARRSLHRTDTRCEIAQAPRGECARRGHCANGRRSRGNRPHPAARFRLRHPLSDRTNASSEPVRVESLSQPCGWRIKRRR